MLEGTVEKPLTINLTVEGYDILGPLGAGGFCKVYKAKQCRTDQLVALKVLTLDPETDIQKRRRQIERFEREAQLCAKLHHPNVVRLLDKGRIGDFQLYAVFEYVPGETLKDLIMQEGALSAPLTGELMGQILDALACAHDQGIVHRDLKPQNIMVTTTGTRRQIKILDFGIGAFTPDARQLDYKSLTLTQEAIGTPSYSAPEQLRGEPPTTKSDLYAWGLVFIECLTGFPAMRGSSLAEIFHKQLSPSNVPLPPAVLGHPLAAVLGRALQKNPRLRAEKAAHLYEDFQKVNLSNIVGDIGGLSQPINEQVDSVADTVTIEGGLNSVWATGARTEKRQISVLCCSLSLTVAVDADIELEVLDAIQRDQLSLINDTAMRYGGHIAGTLGDTVMIYFGYPSVSDNDARRATRTALELSGIVKRRSAVLEVQQGLKLNLRVGMHTGTVIVRQGEAPTGLTPNIALRLERIALPGTVLASNTTRQLLEHHLEFEEHGTVAMNSIDKSFKTFLLVGERHTEALTFLRSGSADRPMIGRENEFRSLLKLWQNSTKQKGSAILLRGEAGIGKSRLSHELRSKIRSEGFLSRDCRCLPEHQNNALYPFLDMLKQHWHLHDVADPTQAAAKLEEALSEHRSNLNEAMPILCAWMGLPLPEHYVQLQESPERQKQILLKLLSGLILQFAEKEPFLLLVEDLHWVDPTSIELLNQILSQITERSILVLCTARPEFKPNWDLNIIDLSSLQESDTEQMIQKVIGDKTVEAKTLAKLAERTGGIPLFVEELTRMLVERKILVEQNGLLRFDESYEKDDIPITLKDSLNERLDRLGQAKETAQMAATIGREFDYSLLVNASLKDELAVQADLEQLLSSDLLYRQRKVSSESYIFRHALIRDAAYDSMVTHTRKQSHAAVAKTLEKNELGSFEVNPAELARHFALAEEFNKAVSYGQIAARSALERSAASEAIAQSHNVLAWINNLPAVDKIDAELTINSILTPALMNQEGWASKNLKAIATRSQSLVKESEQSLLKVSTLWWVVMNKIVAGDRAGLIELGQEVLDIAEASLDPGHMSAAQAIYGYIQYTEGHCEIGRNALKRAVELYDPQLHGDHGTIYGFDTKAWALASLARVSWDLGDIQGADRYAQEAVDYSREIKHVASLGIALLYQGIVQQYNNDKEAAGKTSGELLEIAERYGLPAYQAYGYLIYCWASNTSENGLETIDLLKSFGSLHAIAFFASLIAEVFETNTNYHKAMDILDDCIKLCDDVGEHYYEPQLYLRRGVLKIKQNPNALTTAKADFEYALTLSEQQGMAKVTELINEQLTHYYN